MGDLHRSNGTRSPIRRFAPAVVALIALLIALTIWLQRPPRVAQAAPQPVPSTRAPTPSTSAGSCSSQAAGTFTPTTITIPGIVSTAEVLALPRDRDNLPSTPPETEAGKREFAWDRPPGIMPGARQGNVLLNAHAWPDNSALGNLLLKDLGIGDRLIVRGGGRALCYRVQRRIEVQASTLVPSYYSTDGPPQLGIIVCSGRRLGPSNWTRRTIWYASPDEAQF